MTKVTISNPMLCVFSGQVEVFANTNSPARPLRLTEAEACRRLLAHDGLLNACKAIVAGWGHQDGVSKAVELARAAIAKLEGGAK